MVKPFETWFGYPNYRYPLGAYGVFTAWDFGNIVNTLGERIPVWSRWPSEFTAQWLVSENEEKSLRLLCRRCEPSEEVRYVVLDARTIAQHFLRKVAAVGRRLKDYDAQTGNSYSLGADVKIPQRTYGPRYKRSMAVRLFQNDARNLGHYRLVYKSPRESYITYFMRFETNEFGRVAHDITSDLQREVAIHRARAKHVALDVNQFEYDGSVTASVKIFEVVQGAHVMGDARAGTVAEARLQLRCGSSKHSVEYVRSAVAGPGGRFDLVVAHPSGQGTDNTTCEAMGPYTLLTRISSEVEAVPVASIAVTARQVREGTRIELGELSPP